MPAMRIRVGLFNCGYAITVWNVPAAVTSANVFLADSPGRPAGTGPPIQGSLKGLKPEYAPMGTPAANAFQAFLAAIEFALVGRFSVPTCPM